MKNMNVVKRDGRVEEFNVDKILARLNSFLPKNVLHTPENTPHNLDFDTLLAEVKDAFYDNMLTSNIDEVIAQHCFLKSKTDVL